MENYRENVEIWIDEYCDNSVLVPRVKEDATDASRGPYKVSEETAEWMVNTLEEYERLRRFLRLPRFHKQ